MKESFRSILRGALALVMVLSVGFGSLLSGASPAEAATAPSLGTAANYAVLAGTTVTSTGATAIIGGDVGVAPGSAITGFPPGTVLAPNIIHTGNDAPTILAKTHLTNAYTTAAGQPADLDMSGTDLGGQTLVPGVYKFTSDAQLTGDLTLAGPATGVWIFQIGSSFTAASNSRVLMSGGGQNCNVFWQVGSSATLGTASAVVGNILALTSITLDTGATLAGRALARNGAVTLATSAITVCSICPVITLAPTTLPAGVVSTAYSQTITATGGTGPYTYAIIAGAPPTGLTLAAGGLLSGTPTATGTFTFTVRATDTGVTPPCYGSRIYVIIINPAGGCPTITIAPAPPLPEGTIGIAYPTQTFIASGGTAPYTYAATGSLPAGFILAGNVLTGTPIATGIFTFTITATDAAGCLGAEVYMIVINNVACPPIVIKPASLPQVVEGTTYSVTLTASGGKAPYIFSRTSGSLPQGLSLSSGGVISGIPKKPGTSTFTVSAIDANGCLGAKVYHWQITLAPAVNPRGSGGVPAPSNQGVSGSQTQPGELPKYMVNSVCVEPQGSSDKVTLCLQNTGTTPQTVVVTLLGNNATIGQKTFTLGANAVVCESFLVDGAQKASTYRVNIGGSYVREVPLCTGAPGQESSSDWWIYLLIALAVIVIIVILYFVMRKR